MYFGEQAPYVLAPVVVIEHEASRALRDATERALAHRNVAPLVQVVMPLVLQDRRDVVLALPRGMYEHFALGGSSGAECLTSESLALRVHFAKEQ